MLLLPNIMIINYSLLNMNKDFLAGFEGGKVFALYLIPKIGLEGASSGIAGTKIITTIDERDTSLFISRH